MVAETFPIKHLSKYAKEALDKIEAHKKKELSYEYHPSNIQPKDSDDIGENNITRLIIAALKDPDKNVRKEAAETLGLIGDLESIEYLKELLNDPEPSVKISAIKAIGEIHRLNKKEGK